MSSIKNIHEKEKIKEKTSDKTLMVFDMHKTIISRAADYEVIGLLPEKVVKEELPEPYGYEYDWIEYMQEIYKKLAEEKISVAELREHVKKIPLNEGFPEVFKLLRNQKDKIDRMIISGSNILINRWILEHHKIDDLFQDCYSNLATVQDSCLIKIDHYHYHSCPNCDKSICKRILLKEHLNKLDFHYKRIIYVGDGDNDYCPSTILGKNDLLFPRRGFSLHKKILQPNFQKNIKCQVHFWNTGKDIAKIVQKLI